MHRRTSRPLTLGATAALASVGLLLAGAPTAGAAETPSTVSLFGSAYGSTASVGPISSGKTASFSACSTSAGTTYGNNVVATNLGGVIGKAGAVVTEGSRSGNTFRVTSTVGATSLLGGLVQANAIVSTSTSTLAGSALSSSGSTVITGLKIAGLSATVPAGVDSHIDIPGVATLSFNQQRTSSTTVSKQLTVDALRIDLLKGNKLGLAAGSVVIGSATSGASQPTNFSAGGSAYGSGVYVGTLAVSGLSAYQAMSCGGTGGVVNKNKIAGIDLPGIADIGVVTSTAQSVERTGSTTAVLSNTVSGLDLLDGAVTADAITAKASTTRTSAGVKSTDDGTVITNLKVLGTPVTVSPKANTTLDVAGLGTLTLHKTGKNPDGLDVTGLELKLSTDRLGVKAGAVIKVASAKSRVAAS